VVCTGNAARSVMAGFMLEYLSEVTGAGLRVATAGTHVVDGQPVSHRTRSAIAAIDELADVPAARHRSRQLDPSELDRADVVVAMEADHVRYVRRRHPSAAPRTATLRRLCRDLPPGPAPLRDRVAALDLAAVTLTDDEDVDDPAGHDDDVYVACAHQLWALCQQLVERL
jgi:protein-tyrosine phosphatase